VWLAHDRRDDRMVAIKHARRSDEGAPLTSEEAAEIDAELAREFDLLAPLSHPGLLRVLDFQRDGLAGHAVLIMEAVAGRPSLEACREDDTQAILAWAVGLAEVLDYLHGMNLLHGDIKPENVLITTERTPKVIDFGLARHPGKADGGTPSTVAPEVLTDRRADARSDLFSLGATLWYWLFGRYPCGQRSAERLENLRRRLSLEDLPRFDEKRGELPEGLESLLLEMLETSPEARPTTARQLIDRFAALGIALPGPTWTQPAARARSLPLIAREEVLSDAAARTLQGDVLQQVLTVVGPSGSGRTRFIDDLARRARLAGRRVLRLDGSRHAAFGSQVITAFGGEPDAAHLVPLTSALRLVTEDAPAVVLIDDLHLAPADNRRELSALAERLADGDTEPLGHWAIVATSKDEPDARDRPMLTLPAFSLEEVERMLRALLPGAMPSQTLIERMKRASGGFPGRIVDIITRGVGERSIKTGQAGWELGSFEQSSWDMPQNPPAALRPLGGSAMESEATRRVAAALSLDTATSTIDRIAAIAEVSGSMAAYATRRLLEQGWLDRRADGRVRMQRVARPAWRPSKEESAHLHRRFLDALRLERPVGIARARWLSRLAAHAAGAGSSTLAFRLGIRAIAVALRSGRPDEAAASFAQTSRLEELSAVQKAALDSLSAEIHLAAGRAHDALSPLQRAHAAFESLGRNDDAARCLARSARALGLTEQSSTGLALLQRARAVAERDEVLCEIRLEEGILLARQGEVSAALIALQKAQHQAEENSALMRRIHAAQGRCLVLLGRAEEGDRNFAEALKHAPADGSDELEPALIVGRLQAAMSRREPQRVLAQLERARVVMRRRGNADGIALVERIASQACLLLRRWQEAAETARVSAEWREVQGHQAWLAAAYHHLAEVYWQIGEVDACRASLKKALRGEKTAERPSEAAAMLAILVRVLLAEGERKDALRTARSAITLAQRENHPGCRLSASCALARALIANDEPMAAAQLLRQEIDLLDEDETRRLEPLTAEAQVLLAAAVVDRDPAFAETVARKALCAANDGMWLDISVDALGAMEAALAAQGRMKEAARARDWLCLKLEESAARIDDATARERFLSRPDRNRLRKNPQRSTSQRLEALYEIVRELNGQALPERVVDTLLDHALRVLHADRGVVALVSETGDIHVVASRGLEPETEADALALSRTVLERAQGGESILAADPAADPRFSASKSVRMFGIRAVLCVPLRSRGELVGAVYADTSDPGRRFDMEDLQFLEALSDHAALALTNARKFQSLLRENQDLRKTRQSDERLAPLVGRSPAMRKVFGMIESAAPTPLPVLILGESGTGKDLVARAVHRLSRVSDGPFIAVNCAALPETILESTLFGHERGAFTGADRAQAGLVEQAGGGTLFLDEVGDLSPAVQAKFLRVLEDGEVRRLGAVKSVPVEFRLLAATHRDLDALVGEGTFRHDLLFRLDVLRVPLPPLRERLEDLPELISSLLAGLERTFGRMTMAPDVVDALARDAWPGNVRELENTLARMALFARDGHIDAGVFEHDPELGKRLARHSESNAPGTMAEIEKEAIRRALAFTRGHRERAARLLGIGRATIFRKIREYELDDAGRRRRKSSHSETRPPNP